MKRPKNGVRERSKARSSFLVKKVGPLPTTALVAPIDDLVEQKEMDDRRKAFDEACRRFGEGAVIGRNYQMRPEESYQVGKKGQYGTWQILGRGKNWDEAFQNARETGEFPGYLGK